MPSLQIVNTTRDKPEPTGVEEFFSKLGKDYKDKQDRNELGQLLDQYSRNEKDINAARDFRIGVAKSTMSPSKQLEADKAIGEIEKETLARRKQLNDEAQVLAKTAETKRKEKEAVDKAKAKEEQKAADAKSKRDAEIASNKEVLRLGGKRSDEEIDRLAGILTPVDTRRVAQQDINEAKATPKVITGSKEQNKRIDENIKSGKKARNLLLEAPKYKEAIDNLGKEGASTWKRLLSIVPGGAPLVDKFFSKDEQTINTITKESILKSGDLQGLRLTDYKLRYIEGAMPSPLKSYEANVAAYDIWKKRLELAAKVEDVQTELIRELEAKGMKNLPSDFDAQLEERVNAAGLNDELDVLVERSRKAVDEEDYKIPEEKQESTTQKLEQQYPAAKYDGKTIKVDATGKLYVSKNGKWVLK